MIKLVLSFIYRYSHINWILLDQALVSGVNFITGILIARYLGVEEFGYFSLIWLVVTFFSGLQHAVIIAPMLSIFPKYKNIDAKHYWGAVFLQQFFWLVFSFISLVFAIYLWSVYSSQAGVKSLIFPLISTLVAFQTQDFLRKYFFVIKKAHLAFMNDFISYIGQLCALFILFSYGGAKTEYVLWVIAATSAAAIVVSLFFLDKYKFSIYKSKNIALQHWCFSKWLLGAALLQWGSGMNFFLMASGYLLGPLSVGAIKSAQNIVGLINILFMAMDNFIPSSASSALINNGLGGLRKYIGSVLVKGLFVIVPIVVLFSIFSDFWMSILYGDEFIEYAFLIKWLGFIYILVFPSILLGAGLKALEKTSSLFSIQVLMAAFSVVSAYPLITFTGLYGYIIGVIVVRFSMAWLMFRDFNRLSRG